MGEGSAELPPITLVRRLFKVVGDVTVDDRLAIRGIFVGVSFDAAEVELFKVDGWPSFCSLEVIVPTEGEPAIVGN